MRTKLLVISAVMLVVAGRAIAADPIDTEMFPLLEKARSANQADRQEAVRELLALREGVSDELTKIVIDANNGQAETRSKAGALFLMGELGLMQCKDLLDREKDWIWKPPPGVYAFGSGSRLNALWGQTAKMALHRVSLAGNVTLVETRQRTLLEKYPNVAQAIAQLRSTDDSLVQEAEDSVLRWYDVVCRSMYSVLKPSREAVYSNEVKATAAYLLGEYRAWYGQMLLWNIDLKDQNDVCGQYAQTLIAQAPEPQYPCAVAMVKLGYRAGIGGALSRIQTKSYLSQQTRDRIARVLVAIDKDMTEKLYNSEIAGLENAAQWNAPEQDRLSRLQLLRTIEPIIKQ
ncbi:MAG TPA: hypothetical protein VMX13_02035 [Sedimentisphaerales bacterium]|nr:hypothetical protein [Sedimentisphaerales bacterium]